MLTTLLAASVELKPQGVQFEKLGNITIGGLVPALITLALVITALVAFAFLILGGIKWITSGGDKAKNEEASKTITASLIGLAIVFSSWAILSIALPFFGIDVLKFDLPVVEEIIIPE